MERLQKFLSSAGIASRRQAEVLIASGRVKVNGRVVRELGVKVDPQKDKIEVSGEPAAARKEYLYIALNKPDGYVSSRQAEFGRKTVYDLLPQDLRQKVWSVGRLDYETEGLLIFTNDGELTQMLTHPSFEHAKEYEAALDRKLTSKDQKLLEKGVNINGFLTSPAKVKILAERQVAIVIHEGHKRQVRRMFAVLGYLVQKLVRIRIGKLKLADLKLGEGKRRSMDKNDII